MKITMEFNLPDDNYDYKIAREGQQYRSLLEGVYNHLRHKVKYEELTDEQSKIYNELFDWFMNELNEEEVDLFSE